MLCPPWQFPRPIIHGLILWDCHSLLSPEVTSLIHPRCLPLGMGLSFDSGIIIPPCAQSSLGPGTSAGCTRMQNACPPEVSNLMISSAALLPPHGSPQRLPMVSWIQQARVSRLRATPACPALRFIPHFLWSSHNTIKSQLFLQSPCLLSGAVQASFLPYVLTARGSSKSYRKS